MKIRELYGICFVSCNGLKNNNLLISLTSEKNG